MKELYISPELQVMSFAPVETLATDITEDYISFGNLMNAANSTKDKGASWNDGDISLPIP